MDTDPTEEPRLAAIAALERFGLSGYAARTFVGLASLGTATAREVSQVTEVPRTRVYDAIDELRGQGLVDVLQSSPKRFWAVSGETVTRTFEQELEHRTEVLRTALDDLEPVERRSEQRGVWTVDGETAVTDRVLEFFDDAEAEIVYMTVDGLLTEDVVDGLRAAAERGVSVKLGGVSPDVQERIQAEVPGATSFESLWVWSDAAAGRLMMVDDEKTLVSAFANDPEDQGAPRAETAIWGAGDANSVVVVLRAIFTWRLDHETGE